VQLVHLLKKGKQIYDRQKVSRILPSIRCTHLHSILICKFTSHLLLQLKDKSKESHNRKKSTNSNAVDKSSSISFVIDQPTKERNRSSMTMHKEQSNERELSKHNQSTGILFDDWCQRKENELQVKHQILKEIKKELAVKVEEKQQKDDKVSRQRQKHVKRWLSQKKKEVSSL